MNRPVDGLLEAPGGVPHAGGDEPAYEQCNGGEDMRRVLGQPLCNGYDGLCSRPPHRPSRCVQLVVAHEPPLGTTPALRQTARALEEGSHKGHSTGPSAWQSRRAVSTILTCEMSLGCLSSMNRCPHRSDSAPGFEPHQRRTNPQPRPGVERPVCAKIEHRNHAFCPVRTPCTHDVFRPRFFAKAGRGRPIRKDGPTVWRQCL